jgi:uncharacterized protein YndB with AHSA1/START domain
MKTLTKNPIARAQMMIRAPAQAVYEAFVDPAITTKFWFSHSSGRLEVGKQVRWDWRMYGVGSDVAVKALEPGRRILIDWDNGDRPTTVEWVFTPRSDNETMVVVTNSGFEGDGDTVLAQALDSTGGFNILLCGAKAWLEHGIALNLIADHAPDHLVKS